MASMVARVYGGGLGKLKHFVFWMFHGSRRFAHFSKILMKINKIRYLCCLCKKIMGGHETEEGRAPLACA